MKIIILLLSLLFMFSGNARAHTTSPTNTGDHIKVSKSSPPDGYTKIGPISATDGSDCRQHGGTRGTYDGALIKLKNVAATKGGDYIQVTSRIKPHPEGACFNYAYVIFGTLYKLKSKSSPSLVPTKAPAKNIKQRTGYQKLLELKNLLDKGIITKQEFKAQKKKILDEGI